MIRRALSFTVLAAAGLAATAGAAVAGAPANRDPARQMVNLDGSTVVVYDDGRVYRRADMGDWYGPSGFASVTSSVRMAPPPPPGAFEWATLSDDAVDELVDRITELGLLDDDLDFGDPMITDSPTSGLVLTVDDSEVTHSVYAPGYDDGLTAEEQSNRAAYDELRAVLFGLEDEFGDELSKFQPFLPDQWVVEGVSWYHDVDRPWPLDAAPVDGECVELPTAPDRDTATGGYVHDDDILYVDAALPNDPRCA